jgi:predicted CXXCH cytochrome family protein
MKRVHPPFAERDCRACHVAQAAGKLGYPLKSTALTVCGECHADEAAQVRQFAAHGSNDKQSCEQCHNGHASHEAGLLLLPQQQLCRKCHPEPPAGTSTPNPHAKQACTTCHAQHGSAVKPYLAESPLTLCAKCHTKEHHIAHPMGEKATDPNTKQPVTCISCHSLHGWKADPLLPAEGSRDLCVRCHNK